MTALLEKFSQLARSDGYSAAVRHFALKKTLSGASTSPIDRCLVHYCESSAFWPVLDTQLYNAYLIELIEADVRLLLQYEDILEDLKHEQLLIQGVHTTAPRKWQLWMQEREQWKNRWLQLLDMHTDLFAEGALVEQLPWHPVGYKPEESMTFPTVAHAAQALFDDSMFTKMLQTNFTIWELYPSRSSNPDEQYRKNLENLYAYRAKRYGITRLPALMEYTRQKRWEDPHKGEQSYFPLSTPEWIARLSKQESSRRIRHSDADKQTIAHIIPQVVDFTHAPTRLVDSIVSHAKDSQPVILVTDRMSLRMKDMPLLGSISASSLVRGATTIASWRQREIPIKVADTHLSYAETAHWCAKMLKEMHVDVAVFHGPDVINLMASVQCDTPTRVFFDHGTLPESNRGFDYAILSRPERVDFFEGRAAVVPFCYDARAFWESEVYPKSTFGLKDEDLLMTTVSNSLEARLSEEMCRAIAEILQMCPHAYYMPIGPIEDVTSQMMLFQKQGVADRVRFLGFRTPAPQWLRTADLYLNEFPFGSGLAVLEAMAAGVPVISMYDKKGPAQARYGAQYMGVEHAATTPQGYVDLALRLLENAEQRKQWSDHALNRYEGRSNVIEYAQQIEKALVGLTKTYA